ncbi:HAMP domain-containing protein [Desulfonema limicola]|uniref:HAMP domain-containing protein n=1 Tax=Desulfonema limicola TaxID=45656 RepID=UPI001A9B4EAD|nr:HAMP domain-containing protein [Desulfonema limicola]
MKKLKLGTQLNISFALVLFVPMIIATVFSIGYYSQKISEEAVNTISSDIKSADIIYQNAVTEISSLANSYTNNKIINFLIGYNLGEKIGSDWMKSAKIDNLDMITIVDTNNIVLVRSHAPKLIGGKYPEKNYLEQAFLGKNITGTEVLTIEELEDEGFEPKDRLFGKPEKVLAITGAAPVYDRQKENIVAAIVVRRILNNPPVKIIDTISEKLGVNAALFENTRLIASNKEGQDSLMLPSSDILKQVIEKNEPVHFANISEGGNISKYMPINDFNNKPVGILMVQTGVNAYLKTRNIAIITLLTIFCTGTILAFIVKTIIERRILTPVQRLKKGAEQIGSGDYNHKLIVTSGDEIGELTEAFNKMAGALNEYDRQLKEYNQQLEERVQERTSELRIANEQLINANTVLEDTLETLNPGVSRLIGKNQQQLGLIYGTELVADVCTYTKLNMILGETMMGEFMKKFFRESHKLLAQYRGMFDKTVGDQIVAIFGTPKDNTPASPLHPFDAIACALKLIEISQDINRLMQEAIEDNYTAIASRHKSLSIEDRESVKIEDLRFRCRIGINTSNPASDREIDRMRMVMMGAETCVDYTAQGGAVIYAFRLESSGQPGEIYIGENTRRLVEHVYLLEESPPITLKGLGTQTRYKVLGYQHVLGNIYPKCRFYKEYHNQIPSQIDYLINNIKLGRIQIKEVRKINEFLDVDIPYLEHLAGLNNFAFSRALLCHAVARLMEFDESRINSMIFASLWDNALKLRNLFLESMEIYEIRDQIPENIESQLTLQILDELNQDEHKKDKSNTSVYILPETRIIDLCNRYDQMVFDRSFLRNRNHETISTKEFTSLIKVEGKIDNALLNIIEELMIVSEHHKHDDEHDKKPVIMPQNPEELAWAIKQILSDEDQQQLILKLTKKETA